MFAAIATLLLLVHLSPSLQNATNASDASYFHGYYVTTICGTGTAGFTADGSPATSTLVNTPQHLTVDTQGNVVYADTNSHRYWVLVVCLTTYEAVYDSALHLLQGYG